MLIRNGQIHIVLCLDVIEHVKEDSKLVREISRVLKKGSKVILTTPMQNGVSFPFLSEEEIETINERWGHVRKGYSLKEIVKLFKELFKDNNLVIEKVSKYFNLLSRFAYRFIFLSRIPLKGRSLLYQLVIRLEPYIKWRAEEHIIIARLREVK